MISTTGVTRSISKPPVPDHIEITFFFFSFIGSLSLVESSTGFS